MVERLSSEEYWDKNYSDLESRGEKSSKKTSLKILLKFFLEGIYKLLGYPVGVDIGRFYLFKKIEKYLSKKNGLKILEVGCAPGFNLIDFNKKFGYDCYGIEYTEHGAKITQDLFISRGLDPNKIIHGDFFDNKIVDKYNCFFDIVYSLGFIEHFDNPEEVIKKHLDLLKEDGILIITIPNLKGVNLLFTKLLYKEVIKIHNLNIMSIDKFKLLFEKNPDLKTLYCNYLGTVNLGLYMVPQDASILSKFVYKIFQVFQVLLNPIVAKLPLENKWTSPYLIYIGRKMH